MIPPLRPSREDETRETVEKPAVAKACWGPGAVESEHRGPVGSETLLCDPVGTGHVVRHTCVGTQNSTT